jgi:hypothetical protein
MKRRGPARPARTLTPTRLPRWGFDWTIDWTILDDGPASCCQVDDQQDDTDDEQDPRNLRRDCRNARGPKDSGNQSDDEENQRVIQQWAPPSFI